MITPESLVDLVEALDPLADLPRTGWVLRGVSDPASIADHSFSVCVVSSLLVDMIRARGEKVDGEKTLRMALIHDAAEAQTGDVPLPSKTPEMQAALHTLEEQIVTDMLPASYLPLWKEVETGDLPWSWPSVKQNGELSSIPGSASGWAWTESQRPERCVHCARHCRRWSTVAAIMVNPKKSGCSVSVALC